MKAQINHPASSKINAGAGMGTVLNSLLLLGVVYDFIPDAAVAPISAIMNVGLFSLIGVWRTWFTEPK